MKKHQEFHLFNPPFFYNRPMIDREKMQYRKTEDRKAIRKRPQDFPLSDVRILHRIRKLGKVGPYSAHKRAFLWISRPSKIRAAPTYVGRPRRGRLIHWLNSHDRLFCFLRGKRAVISESGMGRELQRQAQGPGGGAKGRNPSREHEKGIFIPVSQLPKQEPRKATLPASAAV